MSFGATALGRICLSLPAFDDNGAFDGVIVTIGFVDALEAELDDEVEGVMEVMDAFDPELTTLVEFCSLPGPLPACWDPAWTFFGCCC